MRYIQKQSPPNEYTEWLLGKLVVDGKRQDCSYDQLRDEKSVIAAIERSLVSEQKYLCCYTGISIDIGTFHVEHLKPQSQCIDNEDVEYGNLLAAYPAPNTPYHPFGAEAKDNWYDPELFISPLDPKCAMRFRYLRDGTVEPVDPDDEAAKKTIEVLKLNHSILVGLRKQVIQRFKETAKKLSISKLEAIASSYCEDSGDVKLPQFCFVIQQIAPKELKRKKAWSQNQKSQNLQRKRRK